MDACVYFAIIFLLQEGYYGFYSFVTGVVVAPHFLIFVTSLLITVVIMVYRLMTEDVLRKCKNLKVVFE
jgi:hypothetical protein